jgi:hypothetical protein
MYNVSLFGIVTMNPPCTMNVSNNNSEIKPTAGDVAQWKSACLAYSSPRFGPQHHTNKTRPKIHSLLSHLMDTG